MARKVKTEEELADAINDGEDEIEIEGDLKEGIIKIKAKGSVAWVIAFGSIAVAAGAVFATYKISDAKAKALAATSTIVMGSVPIATLGPAVAVVALKIAIAAGRASALNDLRGYRIKSNDGENLLLAKK